jgi:hypothetical protein
VRRPSKSPCLAESATPLTATAVLSPVRKVALPPGDSARAPPSSRCVKRQSRQMILGVSLTRVKTARGSDGAKMADHGSTHVQPSPAAASMTSWSVVRQAAGARLEAGRPCPQRGGRLRHVFPCASTRMLSGSGTAIRASTGPAGALFANGGYRGVSLWRHLAFTVDTWRVERDHTFACSRVTRRGETIARERLLLCPPPRARVWRRRSASGRRASSRETSDAVCERGTSGVYRPPHGQARAGGSLPGDCVW